MSGEWTAGGSIRHPIWRWRSLEQGTMTQYWPFSSLIRHGALRERLILSLDLGTPAEALRLVDELARVVGMFKVAKPLYLNCGPDFVREIRRRGGEVFLDLKF